MNVYAISLCVALQLLFSNMLGIFFYLKRGMFLLERDTDRWVFKQ